MQRIISLPTAFFVFFLIFGIPSVLSADSKNIWKDNSCITQFQGYGMSWHQHVSKVFVGEVVWAQPRKEVELFECGFAVGSRNVRHKIIEVFMGRMELGSDVTLAHVWCGIFEEKYVPGTKFIVGLNTPIYKNFPEQAPKHGAVAWELPLNLENRKKAKTFIKCIEGLGLVKEMLKENED